MRYGLATAAEDFIVVQVDQTAPCGQLYGFHLTIEQTQLAGPTVAAATVDIRSGAGYFYLLCPCTPA
jgi:hypothetical protein